MEENENELKRLLMKVKKDSEKAGLKLNIQKTKIMVSGPITSRKIDGGKMESDRFYFLQDCDCRHEIKDHCGIFHRTRTNNFTICMEIQKTSNTQNNVEKEEWNWKHQPA